MIRISCEVSETFGRQITRNGVRIVQTLANGQSLRNWIQQLRIWIVAGDIFAAQQYVSIVNDTKRNDGECNQDCQKKC